MIELMDGGKNWPIPPRIIITPTAMLMIRLETVNHYSVIHPRQLCKPQRLQ